MKNQVFDLSRPAEKYYASIIKQEERRSTNRKSLPQRFNRTPRKWLPSGQEWSRFDQIKPKNNLRDETENFLIAMGSGFILYGASKSISFFLFRREIAWNLQNNEKIYLNGILRKGEAVQIWIKFVVEILNCARGNFAFSTVENVNCSRVCELLIFNGSNFELCSWKIWIFSGLKFKWRTWKFWSCNGQKFVWKESNVFSSV